MGTTTIRLTTQTRDALNALARERGQTLSGTVTRAATLLEQEAMSRDLSAGRRSDESEWLDAEAG